MTTTTCLVISVLMLVSCLTSGYCGNCNAFKRILYELDLKEVGNYSCEEDARIWLDEYNEELRSRKQTLEEASWNYLTDMTDAHAQAMTQEQVSHNGWRARQQERSEQFLQLIGTQSWDNDLVRQLWLVRNTTIPSSSNRDELVALSRTTEAMASLYAGGSVTVGDIVYHLEPELTQELARSRDYDWLLRLWTGFHDNVGIPMRPHYERYVEFNNKNAREKGYSDMGKAWQMSCYEQTDMEETADRLWTGLKPLYLQLHAYVRGKLTQFSNYAEHIERDGPIPAHLLGNMWAQEWQNIADLVMPYPDVQFHNVTDRLIRNNYTVRGLFNMSEDYFTNIGLAPMTPVFWDKSMLTKPADRKVECHGSAHDFYHSQDFRIKMCTEVNQDYLQTVHHEMGHIEYFMHYAPLSTTYRIKMCSEVNGDYAYIVQHEMGHIEYFMQYASLPTVFREGANCAFHEAVGDTIGLMVKTPEHLHKVGLLEEPPAKAPKTDNKLESKREIKYLLLMALEKLPLLPFALVVEKWRYKVFSGEITPNNYNAKWWELRRQYQGVSSPVERLDKDGYFDPGAKYHIPGDVPYLRYFLSFVVQFQFHNALCQAAGKVPSNGIHHCDIYDEEDRQSALNAGQLFKDALLSKGRSKPWPDILQDMTGQRDFSEQQLLDFFKPLHQWLEEENIERGFDVGWDMDWGQELIEWLA